MSNRSNIRRRRNALYKQSPYCRQCGVFMVRPEDLPKKSKYSNVVAFQPDNMCTLEHTVSKLQPNRQEYVYCRNTILCRKCNEENARKEIEQLPIEELRRRSKRG